MTVFYQKCHFFAGITVHPHMLLIMLQISLMVSQCADIISKGSSINTFGWANKWRRCQQTLMAETLKLPIMPTITSTDGPKMRKEYFHSYTQQYQCRSNNIFKGNIILLICRVHI